MLKHPFLANMAFAFQDADNLYLVLDIKEGGDLRYHISKNHVFTEVETRFLVSNIIIAL